MKTLTLFSLLLFTLVTSLSPAWAATSSSQWQRWPYEVVKNQSSNAVTYQVQTSSYFTNVSANNPLESEQKGKFYLPTSSSKVNKKGMVVFTFSDNSQCTVQFSVFADCYGKGCNYYPVAYVVSNTTGSSHTCSTQDNNEMLVLH